MTFNLEGLGRMMRITRESVAALHDHRPRRISFAYTHTDQPKRRVDTDHVGSFSVPFRETIGAIFEQETGLQLFESRQYGNFWRWIRTEEEFASIQRWIERQGARVFLRDCLDLSVALDLNFPEPGAPHTELGALEMESKHHQNPSAITCLSNALAETICDLPFYKDCRFIAAVPAPPEKEFHLPNELTKRIAAAISLVELSGCFTFTGTKGAIKDLPFEEKWAAWEESGLAFRMPAEVDYDGSPVVLIDDKYQSGTTIQFVAARMREAGIGRIYGLCVVKTLRDTDNL